VPAKKDYFNPIKLENILGLSFLVTRASNERKRAQIKQNLEEAYEIWNASVHGNFEKVCSTRTQRNVTESCIHAEEYQVCSTEAC
jgi:hypothetical protein